MRRRWWQTVQTKSEKKRREEESIRENEEVVNESGEWFPSSGNVMTKNSMFNITTQVWDEGVGSVDYDNIKITNKIYKETKHIGHKCTGK